MKDICKKAGCNKQAWARGLCSTHLSAERRNMVPGLKCSVPACIKHAYAKGLCNNHYALQERNGTPQKKSHKCNVPDCVNMTRHDYCQKHAYRVLHNVPLDQDRYWNVRGENNYNWNGGVSDYPDHYKFKTARKKKLALVKHRCELCGSPTEKVHHKDGSKTNHEDWNLVALCQACHMFWHGGRKNKTSKFMRSYGASLKILSKQFGVAETTVFTWHKLGILHEKIDQHLSHKTCIKTIDFQEKNCHTDCVEVN